MQDGPAAQLADGTDALGLMALVLPPDAADTSGVWLTAPRLVELCFQTAGIHEIVADHRLALPRAVRRVRFTSAPEAAQGRLWSQVQRTADGSFWARVVDDAGQQLVELEGYQTVVLEEGSSLPAS